eukprot:CAMPEP_0181533890 /NCGR_PEP_ID=MMETSP1110-20121109/73410_1 /TAXON_ID=174948 /ORGANISM="Symbiodinium sp., Strain CCMP421" /LENGTH=156 /DNA_ID=CAMNT_0023665127 /DNA_START=29 /DNA_END=499 /DNA_ORIENTATION=+
MTQPLHRLQYPPDWRCPNCRRALRGVDCWCGGGTPPATPPPTNLSKSQKIYTEMLKKEPYEDMRQRILMRGQRQLKSQGEYLLSHMGLSSRQLQRQRHLGSSMPDLSRPQTTSSTSTRSSFANAPNAPGDPVAHFMMFGPPAYSPTLAGMACAALP